MKDETKRTALTGLSVAALVVVVGAPAVASWHNLVAFGTDVLHLTDGWEYVVPLTLDGAAIYAAALTLRAILKGDGAFGTRLLTALYALGGAGFGAYHARTAVGGNVPSAVYYAAASLSAVVLWDITLRALRRDQLRALGAIEKPLPRWRLLRWLVAPVETARAWRYAVIEQITDPAEALQLSREARAARKEAAETRTAVAERITETPAPEQSARQIEGATTDVEADDAGADEVGPGAAGQLDDAGRDRGDRVFPDHGSDWDGAFDPERVGLGDERVAVGVDVPARGVREMTVASVEDIRPVDEGRVHDPAVARLEAEHIERERVKLAKVNKRDALRYAFDLIGQRDVPAALEFLRERGVRVDRSYAYSVDWAPSPKLRAVGGAR